MLMQEETPGLARPLLKLLFWLVLVAALIFMLRLLAPLGRWLFDVLQPFIIALIVAYVLHPIVRYVQQELRLGRAAGILVLMLAIVVILSNALIWLIPVLYEQIAATVHDISESAPRIFNQFVAQHFTPETTAMLQARMKDLGVQIRASFNDIIAELGLIKPVAAGGLTAVRSVAGGVVGGVRAALFFVVTTALVTVIAFYYLIDMEAIPQVIRRLTPAAHRERIWGILVEADRDVGGFLRGQLIACLIVGVLTAILLFAVGMKQYAILIGSFAGMMHLIPYLGPIAGGTPAVLWVLLSQQFTSWSQRGLYVLVLLVGFSVIEAFDGLVTQPYVVGKRASLHPLAVMLALAVGAQFGIGGMIIAVPVMCFVRVLWMELFWKWRRDVVIEAKAE